jgi:uncharacterized protein YbaP (TraB family)
VNEAFVKFTWRIGVALLLVAYVLGAPAQESIGQFTQGLLWRIEKPSITPSDLFGTYNIDEKRVTALPEPVSPQF